MRFIVDQQADTMKKPTLKVRKAHSVNVRTTLQHEDKTKYQRKVKHVKKEEEDKS